MSTHLYKNSKKNYKNKKLSNSKFTSGLSDVFDVLDVGRSFEFGWLTLRECELREFEKTFKVCF